MPTQAQAPLNVQGNGAPRSNSKSPGRPATTPGRSAESNAITHEGRPNVTMGGSQGPKAGSGTRLG
ncbi:hypothetical protein FIBSPDRAFT_862790 [Athelia psychrophila]|uniref:Uncharacterized protein n=1 Tax=Athelia psychrophila TaxID=1759441 RepID=A0A166HY57_9AGAM|nr:hypothetical protein FIBSPDRAFT_862790 [Fibularhizoctonia sp. CBS 109695]